MRALQYLAQHLSWQGRQGWIALLVSQARVISVKEHSAHISEHCTLTCEAVAAVSLCLRAVVQADRHRISPESHDM